MIVPGPGSRSYRLPTLPDPTGYYYCTLQLGCRIVVAILGKISPRMSSEFLSFGNFQIPRTPNSCRKERSYGMGSEIWFEFSEPKIDAYGLSSEKKTQNSQESAFSEVEFWEKGKLTSEKVSSRCRVVVISKTGRRQLLERQDTTCCHPDHNASRDFCAAMMV